MNLPPAAQTGLVDLLTAGYRYGKLIDDAIEAGRDEPDAGELQAVLEQGEQALLAILTAVFGPPTLDDAGDVELVGCPRCSGRGRVSLERGGQKVCEVCGGRGAIVVAAE